MSGASFNGLKSKITAIKKNHRNHYKKGQSIIEYVFLITIVIVILLIMGYYIRNSLSGKLREGADTFGKGETYLPSVEGVANPTVVTSSVVNITAP